MCNNKTNTFFDNSNYGDFCMDSLIVLYRQTQTFTRKTLTRCGLTSIINNLVYYLKEELGSSSF